MAPSKKSIFGFLSKEDFHTNFTFLSVGDPLPCRFQIQYGSPAVLWFGGFHTQMQKAIHKNQTNGLISIKINAVLPTPESPQCYWNYQKKKHTTTPPSTSCLSRLHQ
mmetsp:Transcript_44803/g.62780  ORF Transcript_44803/g.62780 Transcript_44803/m.62780 type:complete len:107 (+) Transcript_44803:514-834(+)